MKNPSWISVLCLIAFIAFGCGGTTDKNTKWKTVSGSSESSDKSKDSTSEISEGAYKSNLPAGFSLPEDALGRRLLKDYGAMFVVGGDAVAPLSVIFKDAAAVDLFQGNARMATEQVGGIEISLQEPAMQALRNAVSEAASEGLKITPRGRDAARRTYQETVELWASRVEPGLNHWVATGRIDRATASRIKSLKPFEQVPEILALEEQGIYFSKDLSKSIVYSVAPPGTSQHLSMLALDVAEHASAKVRAILAKHGWYQTVATDLPHFTFLGKPEKDLPGLGLRRIADSGRIYWLPDV